MEKLKSKSRAPPIDIRQFNFDKLVILYKKKQWPVSSDTENKKREYLQLDEETTS